MNSWPRKNASVTRAVIAALSPTASTPAAIRSGPLVERVGAPLANSIAAVPGQVSRKAPITATRSGFAGPSMTVSRAAQPDSASSMRSLVCGEVVMVAYSLR